MPRYAIRLTIRENAAKCVLSDENVLISAKFKYKYNTCPIQYSFAQDESFFTDSNNYLKDKTREDGRY